VDATPAENAPRAALRLLVDTYARDVDRRDTAAVAALFSERGRLVAHFGPRVGGMPAVRTGRADIEDALVEGLRRYEATTHVVGGQVVAIDGDSAQGETVCLAHHIYERAGERRLLVLAVRYEDTFVREDGEWRFAERALRLDWRDDRPLDPR
jgi:hypothetical protein